ncbi:MAG: bifunctional folylpolyglutamate synthase/dihydrofolate synthase [Bacteroidota bacterium]
MTSSIHFLYSLHKFGMKFGLRNIRLLLTSANDPHRQLCTIHVAGTNGKGSTSSMIAAILTAAGFKVGLYTSPHLVRFNERIRINGRPISDKELTDYTNRFRPEIERINATFFEAVTAIAFNYFADQHVDIAVIETGLGGRLDATNVLQPLVSVITTIGKDHTEQLGNTITSIAREKAGIIKRRVPVVIGKMDPAAKRVMMSTAKEKLSPLIEAAKISLPKSVHIQLNGQHQVMNAKAAVAAVNIVSSHFIIGDRAIHQGLSQTQELSGLRARQELLQGRPNILLDAGHNPDGIKTLVEELKKREQKKLVIIFAVMKDKDHHSILKQFKQLNAVIIATQPNEERALRSEILFEECKQMEIRSFHAADVKKALRMGKNKAGLNGLVVITGSHYLIGEALPLLEKKS